MTRSTGWLLGIALTLLSISARAEGPLEKTDGTVASVGPLVSIDRDGRLQWESTDGKSVEAPLSDVVRWGAPVESLRGSRVYLVGGSLLVAEVRSANDSGIVIDSTLFGDRTLPLELVRGVMLQPPGDLVARDLLARRILGTSPSSEPPPDKDLVVLTNGDELSGVLVSIDRGHVELDAAVGRVKVEVERVAAIVFNPSLLATLRPGGPRAWLGFADGSLVETAQLAGQGGQVSFTPAGLTAKDTPAWEAPIAKLVLVQTLGRTTYLSDLEAESYKHVPYLDVAWPYRVDRSVIDTHLRAGGQRYVKGLGMHSAARLTYRLDKPYEKLQGRVAIDDSTAGAGSATFRVFVDSQQRYASEIVRGGMPPVPFEVDVRGGQRVSLVVDFAERGDVQDRADWLDVRLVGGRP